MKMQIIMPGLLTTVQDAGRFGYLKSGITTSGVMDDNAYHSANAMLDNPEDAAVLEATYFGPTILFDGDPSEQTVIAVTGADMNPCLDGRVIDCRHPILVHGGQTLSLDFASAGCRAYIAVSGGIDVPLVMGSRSTNLKCKMGGYRGRALKCGDEIALFDALVTYDAVRDHVYARPDYEKTFTLHVVMGPQDAYFTAEGIRTFLGAEYAVTEASDRMGCRLSGPAIASVNGTDIVSDAIVAGSIQIPANGQPIILLKDRQTTGGYAKIATVLSTELWKLAQAKPGDHVRFVAVKIKE